MAKKLRENMPKSYTLLISDVNSQVLARFVEQFKDAAESRTPGFDSMKVEVAKTARELVERSVSPHFKPAMC